HPEQRLFTPSLKTGLRAVERVKKGFTFAVVWMSIGFILPWVNPATCQILGAQDIPTYSGWSEIRPSQNTFIFVGDTQSTSHWEFWRERNDKERKLIIDEITRREPAFVLHLGDLTTRGSSKKHWQEFDELHREFRRKKIPYIPTMGNHEFYGNDQEALHHYFRRFPHLEHRRWYSFTWKNIAILMVDSNFSKMTEAQIDQQSQWYLRELENFERDEEIDFILVCFHEPPFTNSRVVKPNKASETHFADPFLRFQKTRILFNGHCHSYERFQVGSKFFVVSGGGGGPRHKVSIDPAERKYSDLYPGPELRFFHFGEIENQNGSLCFRVLRLDDPGSFTIVDPLTILRGKR
ncbi:MAG: hypothetical protein A2W09_06550, partial [Deltaproteobacteria bacterium RBG_16_50_11]